MWPIIVVNGFMSICPRIGFLMFWVLELTYQCGGKKENFDWSVPPPLLLSTVYQCDGYLYSRESGAHSWLCKVWPTISAVSIFEHVAKSGSIRMS